MPTYCVGFRRQFEVFVQAPSLEAATSAANASLEDLDWDGWETGRWRVVSPFEVTTAPNHGIKDGKIVHIDDVEREESQ